MENTEAVTGVRAKSLEYSGKSAYAEDLDMARAIADGDRVLFKDVYDRNVNTLFNLARRLAGTNAEAEDIVQDTFIRAYQKIHLFAGRSALSSWLYRICLNVGLEYLRKKKGTFEDLNDGNCGTVEPDQKKLILRRRLEKAIKKLPEGCRTVFVLHDIEGFNHKEIAGRLNLAEGTSKSQLFKARALLRKILTGREND
jgi:RNA polymerase sigma-70 factor (ECF subfamily)